MADSGHGSCIGSPAQAQESVGVKPGDFPTVSGGWGGFGGPPSLHSHVHEPAVTTALQATEE